MFLNNHQKVKGWECWIYGILSFLCLLPGLQRGFSLDEYKTLMVTRLSWPQLINDRLASGHLPTYFALEKLWSQFAGDSEFMLRLPGAIMTALGAVFAFKLGARLAGRHAAHCIGLIYAIHQSLIWGGQSARPYGGILLAAMLLFWSAAEWWATGRRLWIILVFAASLLGIAFMPLAGLLPLSIALATLPSFRRQFSRAWPLVLSALAAIAVGLLPALLLAKSQTKLESARSSFKFPHFSQLGEALANSVYGDDGLWARGGIQYVAAAILVGLAWLALRKQPKDSPDSPPWKLWLGTAIILPLLALIITSSFTGESMVTHQRYRIPSLCGLIVLMGLGLSQALALRNKRWLTAIIAFVLLVPMAITTVFWWRYKGEGVKEVVSEILRVEGDIPSRVAGHGRWFRLELPKGKIPARELFLERAQANRNEEFIEDAAAAGNDVQVFSYNKDSKDVEPIRAELTKWAEGNPFWLFVYIQRKDGLDEVAKHPPDGFQVTRTIKSGYTRAFHLEPVSQAIP